MEMHPFRARVASDSDRVTVERMIILIISKMIEGELNQSEVDPEPGCSYSSHLDLGYYQASRPISHIYGSLNGHTVPLRFNMCWGRHAFFWLSKSLAGPICWIAERVADTRKIRRVG